MLNDFLIFVAPGLIIVAAVFASFWTAGNDDAVDDNDK